MQYISSDTNVWIDFSVIKKADIPFRLPYKFIMSRDAIDEEIISPPGLGETLVSFGLVPVEITIDEYYLADQYGSVYKKLSVYDRIALAIAKQRAITLLTGDAALRKAAKKEDVPVIGTLGIIDKLWEMQLITKQEYNYCLLSFLENNGKAIRLPKDELLLRINRLIAIK